METITKTFLFHVNNGFHKYSIVLIAFHSYTELLTLFLVKVLGGQLEEGV